MNQGKRCEVKQEEMPILYIKMDEKIEVREPKVTLQMMMQMECSDHSIVNKLQERLVIQFQEGQYTRTVVSILKIYEKIHEVYPKLQIVNLGPSDVILAYENQKAMNPRMHVLKAGIVSVITFIGSAYSIMAFSNDVDTLGVFDLIYELIVGHEATGFTVLEASYSIGLVVGIIVFFNHFGGKRLTQDPTPMEVEMRLYEQDIQTTLVQDYSRKGEEIDVGKSGVINHHRSE